MSRLQKVPILVVDDNEATCTLVTAVLQNEFQVVVVSGGAEAIDRLRTERYAAILLDLKMPLVDGYAVLEFLKEHQPDMVGHVVVLTAALTGPETARLADYAVCGIVSKPFEIEYLLSTVRDCSIAPDGGRSFAFLPSGGTVLLLLDLLGRVTTR